MDLAMMRWIEEENVMFWEHLEPFMEVVEGVKPEEAPSIEVENQFLGAIKSWAMSRREKSQQ